MQKKLPMTTRDISLSNTLHTNLITPEYFLQHYEDFLVRYIAKGNPTSDTMRSYCSRINFFLRWCLDNQCSPLELTDYQMRLYREYLTSNNYQNDSIHIMIIAVRSFYHTAMRLGLISMNPCDDIETPTVYLQDHTLSFYSMEQMSIICSIFEAEEDPFVRLRNTLILYLMGVEGLRNVEVHRACKEDINWEVKAIMIRGKGGKGRMEPIYPCAETFELLEQYLSSIPPDKKIQKDGMLTPLILSNSHNNVLGRISRNGLRFIMNKALQMADLKHKGLSCHVFRHSCGTNLYQNTKDLRIVQETLRQKDPKVTARYAHVSRRISNRVTASIASLRNSDNDKHTVSN